MNQSYDCDAFSFVAFCCGACQPILVCLGEAMHLSQVDLGGLAPQMCGFLSLCFALRRSGRGKAAVLAPLAQSGASGSSRSWAKSADAGIAGIAGVCCTKSYWPEYAEA